MTNVLVIMADALRRDALGCMGHPIVKTPNIDALAARGAVFDNAYTPSPMCVPARAAIATGNYVHRIGAWDSASPYAGTPQSWMHRLRDQGVPVTSIGKLHFRSEKDDNGFSREILPMHVANETGWTLGPLRGRARGYDRTADLATDIGYGDTDYTRYDRAVSAAAVDFIRDGAASNLPWAAFVSFVSPHYPMRAPEDYRGLYDPADMDEPIAYGKRNRPRHPEIKRLAKFFNYDDHFDPGRMTDARAAYYALCTFLDDQVGRVLDALDETGQSEDTIILFASDHGEMLGDHGIWTKQVMYEGSVGVPLIAAGPGFAAGRRVKTAVSLLDLHPTILSAMGLHADPTLPGHSLIRLASCDDDPDRAVFSEYHDGGSTTGFFMVRWAQWKYVHFVGVQPQLFNLANDPDERRSLASNHGYRFVLKEARDRLHAVCNPDAVDAQAFSDQDAKIKALGGVQACLKGADLGHTQVPKVEAGGRS